MGRLWDDSVDPEAPAMKRPRISIHQPFPKLDVVFGITLERSVLNGDEWSFFSTPSLRDAESWGLGEQWDC